MLETLLDGLVHLGKTLESPPNQQTGEDQGLLAHPGASLRIHPGKLHQTFFALAGELVRVKGLKR